MLDKNTYRVLKQKTLINECYEEMVEIPTLFARFFPHPYEKLGASYGEKSPFYLRREVISKLRVAQEKLNSLKSGYRLKVFDAYRPLSVQKFMIEYDSNRLSLEMFKTKFKELSNENRFKVEKIVSHFWSPISEDVSQNPPPHSTGGALDITIVDEKGVELDMGTEIDELIDASESDYYIRKDIYFQKNRELLVVVMSYAGFTQLPTEWWHFSYGDQIWALDNNRDAKYGIYIKSV